MRVRGRSLACYTIRGNALDATFPTLGATCVGYMLILHVPFAAAVYILLTLTYAIVNALCLTHTIWLDLILWELNKKLCVDKI